MMLGRTRNRMAHSEIDNFLREGMIDADTYHRLAALYPVTRWNWHSLGRWFLLFGAISCACGAFILLHDWFYFTLVKLAWILGLAGAGLFAGGATLKRQASPLSARVAELLAAFCLIGLTFTLGIIYSSGSGNWPALVLIDLALILVLTYVLNNVLLLTLSAILFFVWFGGVTGYASDWGAYWFSMNFPLRFTAAATSIIALGIVHAQSERGPLVRYRGFYKVWLSSGLFFLEMALWLLSIFGNFDTVFGSYHADVSELICFNLAWASLNAVLIYIGAQRQFRMVTGYGATFLIIHLYTLFFSHVAAHLNFFVTLLLSGGSALTLAVYLEKRRRDMHAFSD